MKGAAGQEQDSGVTGQAVLAAVVFSLAAVGASRLFRHLALLFEWTVLKTFPVQLVYFVVQAGLMLVSAACLKRCSGAALGGGTPGRRDLLVLVKAIFLYLLTWGWLDLTLTYQFRRFFEGYPRAELEYLAQFWSAYYGIAPYSLLFSTLLVVVVAPIFEEACHCVILAALKSRMGAGGANLVAALLFAGLHIPILGGADLKLVGVGVAFLFHGYCYLKSGNWWTAVTFHGLLNLTVIAWPLYRTICLYSQA